LTACVTIDRDETLNSADVHSERIPMLKVFQRRQTRLAFGFSIGAACWLLGALHSTAAAQGLGDIEGFTEPYRKLHVACSETGIVASVHVRIGDRVKQGQTLVTLDSSEHRALLELAQHQMNAHGRLAAVQAEARLRQVRLDKLVELAEQGYAHEEELQRARTECEVAAAQVLGVQEDILAKSLEVQRLQVQLDNRTIKAAQSGVVVDVLKEPGEFVSFNDPNVVVMVVVDRLLATFSIPQPQADSLKVGQKMRVYFASQSEPVEGTIDVVSPVTDAESGTTNVQVLLDNAAGKLRGGEHCTLRLPE